MGLDHYAAIGFHNLGQVQLEMGELAHARKSLERAAEFWNQPASGPFADNYNLVCCLLALGDLARAKEFAARGLSATREWPRVHAEASCASARVHIATGQFAQAIRVLEAHVFGHPDLGASTEMVLCHYLQAKLLDRDLDADVSEVAARLRERKLDPRLAPDTQAILAAVEHEQGACGDDCGEAALASALDWRDRGAALMASRALLIAGPAALSHHILGAGPAVARALTEMGRLGTVGPNSHWIRLLAERTPSLYRLVDDALWSGLLESDIHTWAKQLLDGGLESISLPAKRASALATLECRAGSAELALLAAASGPDIAAVRYRLTVKHAGRLFVRSFGKLTTRRGGWDGPPVGISKRRERALMSYLVAHFGESISRDAILDALWPETTAAAAVNSLNQTIFQVRRQIDPEYRDGISPPYLLSTNESIELNPDLVKVDWHELERKLGSLRSDSEQQDAVKFALRALGGEFLHESLYDDWSSGPRQRVHDAIRSALLPLSSAELVAPDARVRLAEALVVLDEYDELAHVSLARALALSGRRVAGLRIARDLASRLRGESVEPSEPLVAVIAELGRAGVH